MTANRLEQLVSAQAERTPDKCALIFADQRISYRELDERSNRLCRLLQSRGLVPGDRVCLFVPKGIDAIVGMLGTLKAGAAYVPIDLESPASRVQRIIDSCEPAFVIVAPQGSKLYDAIDLQASDAALILTGSRDDQPAESNGLVASFSELDDHSPDPVALPGSGAETAHILFTSGSTGMPKGVVITHANVIGFLQWSIPYFQFDETDEISGHPPLHFDLSTFDIFASLSSGATLHLVPPSLNLLAPKLAEWIRSSQLTQWFSVPSVLTYMAKFDVVHEHDFPNLKRLMWCGEVLPTPTLRYWMQRLPHVTFTNLYGPTEATIASSFFTVEKCPTDEFEDIPIGAPCAGETLFVLSPDLDELPVGETGDLYIGGVGLSPGYWRDDEKTGDAFVPYPASNDPNFRIYRTGDLATLDAHGMFHYVGRVDSQIKSRGHRIELGEIESALNTISSLRECAVIGVDSGGFEGVLICCAFAWKESTAETSPAALRKELMKLVPKYMLPARWQCFETLPKNANGKIDRSRIREVFTAELTQAQSPPQSATNK